MWTSDGTEAGTVMVKDIHSGSGPAVPYSLTDVGGTLYFTAFDARHGPELWMSDGTEAGTGLVKDIHTWEGGSYPAWLLDVGGIVYFRACDRTHGDELWRSDGTEVGTSIVRDTWLSRPVRDMAMMSLSVTWSEPGLTLRPVPVPLRPGTGCCGR